MNTFSLQSGSNGNCIYVEAGQTRLLFDAGISGRRARDRMAEHGRDIRKVDALILSHDHGDHVGCAGVLHRLFGFPIYVTEPTWRASKAMIGKTHDVRHFVSGQTLTFGDVRVHTIRTPHDAVDGVVFIVEHAGVRLGIFTDLGHPFADLCSAIGAVHGAYVESNYDPDLLETGPYTRELKQRIRGGKGHLSNEESVSLVRSHGLFIRWIAIAHLSAENNRPDLALGVHRRAYGDALPVHLAGRSGVSHLMTL